MSAQIVDMRPLRMGGNGDLFLGRRGDNGEFVVVKYLRDHHLSHVRRAFAREVRILRRRFRGLVPVLFADPDGPRPYYVMPYLPGGSVAAHAGRLSAGQLQTVATEVATALADLHAQWIAHGDVKPDNILLSADGHLSVADPLGNGLGCTMLFSENHGGTPGYWAPEVAAGGEISRPGDVYSYGATLYHLSTGARPRDGQRLDPPPGYESAPKIWEIIAACCQANPSGRPSMREVLRMLRGERWVDIETERRQRHGLVTAACVVGGLFLVTAALRE